MFYRTYLDEAINESRYVSINMIEVLLLLKKMRYYLNFVYEIIN